MENEEFIKICTIASSMRDAAKKLNMTFSSFKRKAIKLGCYKTNQNWSKGKSILNDDRIKSKYTDSLFCENSHARRDFIKGLIIKHNLLDYRCSECDLNNIWNNRLLVLQLDHINGIRNDNRLENLRFLCPNCHSQTETWCSNTNGNALNSLDMDYIIENIKKSTSVTNVINKLGICDTKSNRSQINNIIKCNNLNFQKVLIKQKDIIELKSKNYCECGKPIRNDSKTCEKCWQLKQRKVERPTLEQLLKDIEDTNYIKTGKKYGVSDNSIRKWIKNYRKNETN